MKKELKKRIITSIVLIAIVLNCLFINNYSWLILLTTVAIICWFEFASLSIKIWRNKFQIILINLLSFSYLYIFTYSAYKTKIYAGENILV